MKEKEPLVSVIVPVYNVEKYLRRCLESVINQTYKKLEIILVDDGSTDRSGEICDEYAKKDKRIKVIHKENGGLSSARNVGADVARGEFACYVDSDDKITKDYVSYLLGLIKEYNTDVAIATYSIVTKSNRYIGNEKETERLKLSEEDALRALLLENLFTVSANAKMYSKKLYKSIRYPVDKLCEDNGTTYKFIMKNHGAAVGNKSVYYYYKNDESIMMGKFTLKKIDLIDLVDEMCRDIVYKFANLKPYTDRRKVIARFSILRQICSGSMNDETRMIAKKMRKYILSRKKIILGSDIYSKRDKIAALSLLLGLRFFGLSWKLYSLKEYR